MGVFGRFSLWKALGESSGFSVVTPMCFAIAVSCTLHECERYEAGKKDGYQTLVVKKKLHSYINLRYFDDT